MPQLAQIIRGLVCVVCALFSMSVLAGGVLLERDPQNSAIHHQKVRQVSQLPITWYLSIDGLPGSGLSNIELQAILQTAFDTWELSTTSNISFTYAGESNEHEVGVDGINLVTFTDQNFVFDPGVLAVALTYTFATETTITDTNNDLNGDGVADLPNGIYPAGSIYEADIVFNASYDFQNTGIDGSVDLQSVALHEIGHSVGLSHSVVDGAVMYPFLSSDIASARMPKADDLAYLSYLYPDQPAYSSAFGSIAGTVSNGFNSQRVLGAHVFALDPASGNKIVGAYSLEQGDYLIPGLPAGNYYVGIEPLDGDPLAADPQRINEVIAGTFDTNFTEEFYDTNESSIETDTQNAEAISVVASAAVSNINLVTNTVEVPGVSLLLRPGLNLMAYPVETPNGFAAYDLLAALGSDTEVNSIDHYNIDTGRFERVTWVNGAPGGENFTIHRGDAYLVHMQVQKVVIFRGTQNCPTVDLGKGFNLLGVPCPPAGYSAYDLLESISDSVLRVMRYDPDTASWQEASFDGGGLPQGVDFTISNGEGYVVETRAGANGVLLPGKNQLFPPFLSGVSPGRGVPGTTVLLSGQGFSTDAAANDVSFNGVRAAVTYASADLLTVTVPTAASSGAVNITVDNRTSNSIDFIVEPFILTEQEAANKDLIGGQTVQGSLDTDGEQDRYTFIASKGSLVTITANSVVAGIPDLILALEGPYGGLLTSDDNSGGGSNPRINRFEIPRTGRYTAVVTSVPGSGVGAYTMNLQIENRSTVPEINVLSGDFQTGIMGTVLPQPMEILITGATGAPMAGVPVTIVTDDSLTVSNGFTAASYSVTTNGNGIANVTMTLPFTEGEFTLVIQVPGFDARTVSVASLQRLPAFVEKTGDGQNCGGEGCPVNEYLPLPYKLRFLDSDSLPLQGVLTKFVVASGEGKMQDIFLDEIELTKRSDVNGEVQVVHRMGTRLRDENTKLPIPQMVAAVASIPNSPGAILFQSTAKAGNPATIVSRRTSFSRMTMWTTRLNAVHIQVKDQFDNPVANAPVTMTTAPLGNAPGVLNGEVLPSMNTNEDGEFVGMVIASGVAPTVDEMGGSIGSPYSVNISVAGAGSQNYTVQVDMGPELVGTTQNNGAQTGMSGWVGKLLARPVVMQLFRYQRTDQCQDGDGDGFDDDNGDWTDENFNLGRIRLLPISGVPLSFDVVRTDNGEVDGNSITPTAMSTDGGGFTSLQLTMGQARGGIDVTGRSTSVSRNFTTDPFCLGDNLDMPAPNTVLSAYTVPALTNTRELLAVSPRIEIVSTDSAPAEPSPDPLPSITSYSGIDLSKVNISLNGQIIFDGANLGVMPMNQYPNFIQASFDGAFFSALSSDVIAPLSPGEFRFVYYPKADELILTGNNTVQAAGIKDKAGNIESAGIDDKVYEQTFSLP